MLEEQPDLIRLIVEQAKRFPGEDVPKLVFDVLHSLEFDTAREPSVEVIKPLLIAALRAAETAKGSPTVNVISIEQQQVILPLLQNQKDIVDSPRLSSGAVVASTMMGVAAPRLRPVDSSGT